MPLRNKTTAVSDDDIIEMKTTADDETIETDFKDKKLMNFIQDPQVKVSLLFNFYNNAIN